MWEYEHIYNNVQSKSKSSRSSSPASPALNYASQLNQAMVRSFSPVPQVGGYTIPGSRPYSSPDRWSEQQERTKIFPIAVTGGQGATNVMAAQGTPKPLAVGLGFLQDVGEALVGGRLLPSFFKPNVSQGPILTPSVPGGGSLVARAGQGVVGQTANKLSETAYRLGSQISQAGRIAGGGGAAGATTKGLFTGTLVPTVIAGGGLGGSYLLSGQGQGQPQGPGTSVGPEQGPTQIDPATESSLIRQIRPSDNFMGGGYGGQGTYGGGQNAMGQFDQEAFLRSMYEMNRPSFLQGNQMGSNSGMILPPDRSGEAEQPPPEQPPPEQPPPYDPVRDNQAMLDYLEQIAKQNTALAKAISDRLLALSTLLNSNYASSSNSRAPNLTRLPWRP
ncbi:MAG: hypothetical protein ACOY40_15125 [Bacillota bacterium]